jgi:hypothetical protein
LRREQLSRIEKRAGYTSAELTFSGGAGGAGAGKGPAHRDHRFRHEYSWTLWREVRDAELLGFEEAVQLDPQTTGGPVQLADRGADASAYDQPR